MLFRLASALVLTFSLSSFTNATTVRFDTNVGSFDMQLNPTGNGNLQGHVDNILAYVESGRYDLSVINRAAENFVMQMGGFQAPTLSRPRTFEGFPRIPSFSSVIVDANRDGQVDFDVSNLRNTRGTVSLALSANANTGRASFFVNLGANSSLDDASLRFVPFAFVPDMSTIDLIMSLNQFDYPPIPGRPNADGGLAGDDVPILGLDQLVYVERAFVVNPGESPLMASAGEETVLPPSSTTTASSSASDAFSAPVTLAAVTVPEPPAMVLAVGALMLLAALTRRKI